MFNQIAAGIMKIGVGLAACASAAGLLLASCSSLPDAGGLIGQGGSEGGSAEPEWLTRMELAAERLQCTPQAVHDVVLIERDEARRALISERLTTEAKNAKIEDLNEQLAAESKRADEAEAALAKVQAAIGGAQ